jgi:hypothetical protein
MRISSLFDLITDANDLLDLLFERVETPEQLVSRLERLKRQGTEELFACLEGLRASVNGALNDTLEMNASMDESPEPDEDLSELDDALAGLDAENPNSASNSPSENVKKDEPTAT